MPEFPKLRTGVVTQYPARRQHVFSTRVLQFIDGNEQRFRLWPGGLRQWVIRLELLTEDELSALRDFHRGRAGRSQSFSFIDPWDDVNYPNCTLEDDDFDAVLQGEERGDVTLMVREAR